MKASVFEDLPALQEVYLFRNECIDQRFVTEEEIRGLSKTVNATCGFDKNGTQMITCEKFEPVTGWEFPFDDRNFSSGHFLICEMTSYTIIRDITYFISDPFNDIVTEITFSDNPNIEFLPIQLHQSFPTIRKYYARRCAIREISKRNFENLIFLKRLNLQENQIYAVLKETFEGLVNLKELNLSKFELLC